MTPIKFDTNGGVITTNITDKDWYAYKSNNQSFKTDNTTSHWANAKTADESQWVWIPRYAYKIVKQPNEYKTEGGEIDIIFLKGTSKTEYVDSSGVTHTTLPSGYIVHPAFTNESSTNYKNGGWDKELTGIWVAKYEASRGTVTESTSSKIYPKFVPGQTSYGDIQIGDVFTLCKNLATDNSNPYGFSSSTADTHQMKNSEWGAVAYLAQSKYGRNGVEVTQNLASGPITGCGGKSSYNTEEGQKASTTGNLYGIYDMSGGGYEYVESYLNNSNSNLTKYGQSLISETTKSGSKTSTKYVSVYNVASSDIDENNYNESINKARKGEAIWETSTSGSGLTSWFVDASYFFGVKNSFMTRGGGHNSSGTEAGLFYFINSNGRGNTYNTSFHAVCVSHFGMKEIIFL